MIMVYLFGIRIRLGPQVVVQLVVVVVDLILHEEIEEAAVAVVIVEKDVAVVVGKDVDQDVDVVENVHLTSMDMTIHKCQERLSIPVHVHYPKMKYMT
jgi:hypothetical protein